MTHKDKQDVISVCNILADKMSDSGKVAVQQIIDAVKDMVENEPCEDAISREALLEELGEEPFNWNDSPEEYQEVRDYQWFRSLVENAPSVTPSYNGVKTELKPRRDLAETSQDCISREEVINELKLAYFNKDLQSAKDDPCIVDAMTDWAIRTIKRLPPVTPQQKIGKWIDGKCNRCGTHAPYWAMASTYYCSEYCPNCGCRMKGEGE